MMAHSLSRLQHGGRLPALVLGLFLAYLVLLPLALVLYTSFKPTGFPLDPGFTLQNYLRTYGDPRFWTLAWNTLGFAIGSTFFALLIGTIIAWLLERTDLPFRGFVRILVILPMATPPVLMAIGWAILLSPRNGYLNDMLIGLLGLESAPFNIYSLGGMIAVEALSLVPSTVLILAPAFRNMDPNLEEAALVAGAGGFLMLRRVVLPLLAPALLSASVFLLIVCFVVFDVPGTLGMPSGIYVLSSRIYYLAVDSPTGIPEYGLISAMAVFFLVLLLALAFGYRRMTRQAGRFVVVTGKGWRARALKLGRWRWPAFLFVCLYFLLAVVAPLAILVLMSLMPFQVRLSGLHAELFTLKNHIEFFGSAFALRAAWHSVLIAVVAASAVAVLSLLVSWVVVRSKAPGRGLIDSLAFLPLAIPGVMIGVALIYVYLMLPWTRVYGTIWIIAIAYVTLYLSFGSRTTNSVLLQLHADLEDAARTCGAGWTRTMRWVVGPLMLPALVGVWVWVVAHCMRELSSALMLQGNDNKTLPVLLWGYWSGGQPNKAAAVGVWLILALLLVVVIWQALARRGQLRRAA